MTDKVERVMQAMGGFRLDYDLELTRLDYDQPTWTLTIHDGSPPLEFASHDAALDYVRDALNRVRALAAVEAVEAYDEWLPIESAPHGEPVLLYAPARSPGRLHEMRVGCASWGQRVGEFSNRSYASDVTHWRPLPAPPRARTAEGE